MKKTTEQFVRDAIKVHGDKYDYSNTAYLSAHQKVSIMCKKHNRVFSQGASTHTSGRGCPDCGQENGHNKLRLNYEGFIERAVKAHANRYSYENVVYVDNTTLVSVTCKEHGSFEISPSNHFLGKGCVACAKYGYNLYLPGSIYVMVCGEITKVGITNRDVEIRLAEINKSSGKHFQTIFTRYSDHGDLIKFSEYATLHLMNLEYQRVQETFSGSTECFLGADNSYITKTITQMMSHYESARNDYRPNLLNR